VLVSIDGKYRKLVSDQEPMLKVRVSKNTTSFIRFEEDFYDRLRSRLLFKGTQ